MAIGDLTALPVALQSLMQQNMLAREYIEGLKGSLAYSREGEWMPIQTQIGATLSFTKLSELPYDRLALDPAAMTGLDNGLSPDSMTMEQFTFKVANFAKTADIDLIAQKAIIKSYTLDLMRKQGRQAGNQREAVCRYKLNQTYFGGQTVITSKATATTTTCSVDDVTSLGMVMKNGVWINVSAGAGQQLLVQNLDDPTKNLQITGITPDSTAALPENDVANTSSRKSTGGVSGIVTFVALGAAPVAGQRLKAVNAPTIMRPNAKSTTQALAASDLLTTATMLQAKQLLQNRGVDPYEDGWYRCVLPGTSMIQLFSDADFKNAAMGQLNSPEMRNGQIVRFQGVEYITSNMALTQAKGAGANGAVVNVNVNRPILLGKGAIVRGDYNGLEEFAAEQQQNSTVHDIHYEDGIAFGVRSPMDRLGRVMSSSYQMINDYCCPTDATSTPDLIPQSDYSAWKRAVGIEHAA